MIIDDYQKALAAITEDVSAFAAGQYPKILEIRKAVIAAGDISDDLTRREALEAEVTDLEFAYGDIAMRMTKAIEALVEATSAAVEKSAADIRAAISDVTVNTAPTMTSAGIKDLFRQSYHHGLCGGLMAGAAVGALAMAVLMAGPVVARLVLPH